MINSFFNKESKKTVAFIAFFLVLFVFFLYRAKFGFGDFDESFYLTIPYRMYQGDTLFKDEWNLSLMSGLITYPIMYLYMHIFETTDRIIVNFRYIYICFSACMSLIVFKRLKRINFIGAIICSLTLFIYVPFHIVALSYNSMGLFFFSFSCILYITSNKRTDYVFIGICNALATLCFPLLAIFYIGYYICILCNIKKKTNEVYIILGVLIIFISFILFIFTKISIKDFIKSLPFILSDNVHTTITPMFKLISYIKCMLLYNKYQPFFITIYSILLIAIIFDKNRFMHKDIYTFVCMIAVIILLLMTFITDNYINFMIYPISFLGPILLLYNNDVNKRIFLYMWIPGIVFALIVHLCSNQESYSITGMTIVSTLATIVMISNIASNNDGKIYNLLSSVIFTIFIISILILRINNVYWDGNLCTQNEYISYGPEEGIFTSKEKKDFYYSYIFDINSLSFNDNKVLFLTYDKEWLYLLNDGKYENCSSSAYVPIDAEMLLNYYELNPEKIPSNIYADYGKYNEDVGKILADKFGLYPRETELGNTFYTKK